MGTIGDVTRIREIPVPDRSPAPITLPEPLPQERENDTPAPSKPSR